MTSKYFKQNKIINSLNHRLWLVLSLVTFSLLVSVLNNYYWGARLAHLDSTILSEQVLIQESFTTLNMSRELLADYIKDPSAKTLEEYNRTYPYLHVLLSRFSKLSRDVSDNQVTIDFGKLIQSFTEEANSSINIMKEGDINNVEQNILEAQKVYALISRLIDSLFNVMISDATQFQKNTKHLRTLNIYIGTTVSAFVILVFLIFMRQMLKHVMNPIQSLTLTAKKFTEGEDVHEFISSTDDLEISSLVKAFNAMLRTINQQIEQLKNASQTKALLHEEELANERMRALVKDARYDALQSRINPHFMFNTLNMICQMSYMEKAEKTATLIESLSALLRYNLDNVRQTVTLGDELKTLNDYIYIQELRFNGRISITVKCAEELFTAQIPSLTFQPLVENAVIHGLKSYIDNGRIDITIIQKGKNAILTIEDNGIGINPDKLKELRDSFNDAPTSNESGRIGIYNVYARLAILYGKSLEFRIESIERKGTMIQITFPIRSDV